MDHNRYTLRNGLRIIHQPISSKVAYCGFAINTGARDEFAHEQGMAHFVEHLVFKGTELRSAWRILNGMETVGGEINAYTNKEETVVYSAFLVEHFNRAVGLLGDIVFHSTFLEPEIRKEAEVVMDEIRSYEDNPSELIFDDFENLIFRNHSLGHHILGDPALLKEYTRQDVLNFTSRYYHPSNVIFFVLGDIRFKQVVYQIEKAIGDLPDVRVDNKRIPPPDYVQRSETLHKGTSQAHVIFGCRAYSALSEKRTALYLLNNMLGGPGMNSKLNVSLRERRGLVYNVESNLISYTDTGIFSIYFGSDPCQAKRCLRLIENEMKALRTKKLTESQLSAAKKQLIGQIGVASDNNENNALSMAKTFLHYDKWESPGSVFKRINGLTAEQLQETACELFDPDRMSTLIYL
ncbi:MAG: insulinase family protein [Mediterranea sp.]|jgi:predicted Zn-dependent peptidase|nr:insulinase family protein [Mediterranea sp.]